MTNLGEPVMVKYLHAKAATDGIPISGTFELTQRCNFNCEMCYVHDANKKADPFTAEQWLDMGKQAKDAGTIFLLLTGGEAMVREDFDEIYEGLVKMGFAISINTNGSLIDRHIELFKKYPPIRFNITLYGCDDRAYKSLCHVRSFDKVVSNIKLVKENGMEVRMNHIMTPDNCEDYKKIVDISNELGVAIKPTAYAYPPIRLGKIVNEARLTAEKAAEYTIKMDKYLYEPEFFKGKYKNMVSLPEGTHSNCMSCRGGSCTYWITADGIMRPCGMMPEPDAYPFRDGFLKAWEMTKASTQRIHTPDECVNCKFSGICFNCAAMSKAETGEFNKRPDYVCRMVKKMYELALKETEGEINEN